MRRKADSKRRWLARFNIGRMIPDSAIVDYDILGRLKDAGEIHYLHGIQAVQKLKVKK